VIKFLKIPVLNKMTTAMNKRPKMCVFHVFLHENMPYSRTGYGRNIKTFYIIKTYKLGTYFYVMAHAHNCHSKK